MCRPAFPLRNGLFPVAEGFPTLLFPTVFGLGGWSSFAHSLQLEESISVIGVFSILNKKELLKAKT